MTRYLHSLSATLFYLLGVIVFAAYILVKNAIATAPLLLIIQSAILPFFAVALLYGGTSVYLSLTGERGPSRGLGTTLIIFLTILFLAAAILKFWPTPFILNY